MMLDFIKNGFRQTQGAGGLPGIDTRTRALANGLAERQKFGFQGLDAVHFERFEANFASFEAGVGDDVKAAAIRAAP